MKKRVGWMEEGPREWRDREARELKGWRKGPGAEGGDDGLRVNFRAGGTEMRTEWKEEKASTGEMAERAREDTWNDGEGSA